MKRKRTKFAACHKCRGNGLVWVNMAGQRIHPYTASEMMRAQMTFCDCELGEVKRAAARAEVRR